MTKAEEKIARLQELKANVEANVQKWNGLYQNKKYDKADEIDAKITGMVNEYTSIVRGMAFDECRQSENPMLTAVTMLNFVTIATRDKDVEGLMVREVVEKERIIDLAKLHTYCRDTGGIGYDKNWQHVAQKMNFLLTAQKCKDLGIDPKTVNDSYAMSEIARDLEMGKNPTSNTNLLKTLNMVIEAMLGPDAKALSHDVNYLLSIYLKKNRKALTVTAANHANFRNYIAEIAHRIVTGKAYNVEFRKNDGNKAKAAKTVESAPKAESKAKEKKAA